jgi:uncharacterized protein YdeI (YjbR/CyaY-like superfamily)
MADTKTVEQFPDADAFNSWLSANHADHPGVWMKIAKKSAPTTSVNYQDALDVALAWGWIDGQKRPLDDHYWLQAFTQRRPRSVWSKRNVDKCIAMIEAGTMQPSGLAQVEAAKADGRWDRAYSGQAKATESPEWLAALDKHPQAKAFYDTLNATNRYAFYYRIQDAKREDTRTRRIEQFIAMLERGEALHLFAPKKPSAD